MKPVIAPAFKAAFPQTVPIMTGFLFLGLTYGIYMHEGGFSFWYPCLMALTIYAGSVEFVIASLLLQPFDPWSALLLTLVINARHLFYGISMLDRYRGLGWKKFYIIFGMCDESFAINYATKPAKDIDHGWYMFFVTLLNQCYWVAGATLGGVLGGLITMKLPGLGFVMTALFIVLFLNQFLAEKNHTSAYMGLGLSIIALIIVGKTYFIPVTMVLLIIGFTIDYRRKGATARDVD
ncbi:AzlC family ABC transporter permease [Secundilactobacillus muriivasis]